MVALSFITLVLDYLQGGDGVLSHMARAKKAGFKFKVYTIIFNFRNSSSLPLSFSFLFLESKYPLTIQDGPVCFVISKLAVDHFKMVNITKQAITFKLKTDSVPLCKLILITLSH